MQELVNHYPSVLDQAIDHGEIEWRSPLAADEYAEYWDGASLERLQLACDRRLLRSFWPASGPRWDGLGRLNRGAAVFVEAKAHIPELFSECRASLRSRAQIERAFDEVWRGWGISGGESWFAPYYQYANRLAHAYLLNELNSCPAFLVFLSFIGAPGMNGPETRQQWEEAIRSVHDALGVTDRLPPYVLDAFVDVSGSIPRAA